MTAWAVSETWMEASVSVMFALHRELLELVEAEMVRTVSVLLVVNSLSFIGFFFRFGVAVGEFVVKFGASCSPGRG